MLTLAAMGQLVIFNIYIPLEYISYFFTVLLVFKESMSWESPGVPKVRTTCSFCQGPRFNPLSGN